MKYSCSQKNIKNLAMTSANKIQSFQIKKKGFTLIEIMVSVAIFAVIITAGMGALISMTQSYQVSRSNKQVNEALNYSLEAMTREIRLGRNYVPNASTSQETPSLEGEDGVGTTLKVTTSDRRGTVIYYLSGGVLYLKRFGATNAQNTTSALTDSSQLIVDNIRFSVEGTDSRDNANYQQPYVWIQIKAHATGSERTTVVQSLVSQRTLDA